MILLLIAWHPFHKALFALTLIMMATPPYCTSSSPAYTSLLPLCSVLDPTHFHLVSLISNTSIPHPAISLATCTVRVASAMVLTFQQPMVVSFLGATMGLSAFGLPSGFGPRVLLRPQQRHRRFELCRQCIRFLSHVGGPEDHSLSGLYPSACSVRVTLPGVKDSSRYISRSNWDTQTAPPRKSGDPSRSSLKIAYLNYISVWMSHWS